MKILYGVQGTGNGHISRANAMARALSRYPGIEVTWLYSGRARDALFGVGENFMWREGLTFASSDGELSYAATLFQNNLARFWRDVRQLSLEGFDHIICDYEPVTAWAAKLAGRPCIGIGHQYALAHSVPLRGDNLISRGLLRHFAPVSTALGLHWDDFDQPILPPIVDLERFDMDRVVANKIVVYLPFEDQLKVISLLRGIDSQQFYIYGPGLVDDDAGHIHTRKLSRTGFRRDLYSANGVIANCGFELISECLTLGIRVLTKPLGGQVEQLSNAAALEALGYATVVADLNAWEIGDWLDHGRGIRVHYPPVHERLAAWIAGGCDEPVAELSRRLWQDLAIECDQVAA